MFHLCYVVQLSLSHVCCFCDFFCIRLCTFCPDIGPGSTAASTHHLYIPSCCDDLQSFVLMCIQLQYPQLAKRLYSWTSENLEDIRAFWLSVKKQLSASFQRALAAAAAGDYSTTEAELLLDAIDIPHPFLKTIVSP